MHILRISSSVRTEQSKSKQLGAAIIDKLLTAHPGATVAHKDLGKNPIPHLAEQHLKGFYTPEAYRQPGDDEAARPAHEAIAELKAADILVIEAPLYNLTISSTLKAWLDHIVRGGHTFRHTPDGDIGLLQGKKAYVAVTAGQQYDGPRKELDFVRPLLKGVLASIGITDITFIMADGLNVPGIKETSLQKAIDTISI